MPGSAVRRRVPATKEPKKQKGVLLVARDINQARGMLFLAGLGKGKRGYVLKYYVDKRCPPHPHR